MKKIILVLLLSLPLSTAFGQSKMLIKAGLNIASLSQSLAPEIDAPISRAGFHVGLGADFPLNTNHTFSLQPVLQFSQKGYVADYRDRSRRAATTLNYLELPVNLMARFGGENLKLLAFAGPYVACGIGGSTRETGSGIDDKLPVRFNYDVKRFDYGLQGGVGIQSGYAQLQFFYQQGLPNISGLYNDSRNRVFGVSFAYLFDTAF